jgi:STE24 endopeptidase
VSIPPERRVALAVTVLGGLAFVALALLLVPWHPVPGGTPAPADAGSVFTPAEIERGEDYARWARVWSWSSVAVSLLVACVLGFTRWGRWLDARLPGWWWLRVVLAVAVLALVGRVVTLPFAVLLRRHALDHGLSHQAWSAFAVDLVKGELVAIVATSIVVVVLVGCARRWERAWPAVAGGLLGVLVLTGSFVYPVLIEPLFNSFTSLKDGPLRTEVLALAEREHVPVDDVLVADASRRTTTLNAYVSGFGSTRRVVLYDNLVEDVPSDQALSVVAHELAHARHDDVLTGSLLGAAGAVFGVGLLGLLVGAAGGRRRPAMRDPAVVPLVLALVALGTLLASPVENGISRRIETRADVDALEVTHDPAAFIGVQRQLALHALSDPTPPAWSQWWFGSHPTTLTRIAIARQLGDQPSPGSPRPAPG